MNCRRFSRIASRPCQSATPRLHTASSAKQSKPFPKVLLSISFHISSSHCGGSFLVKVACIVVTPDFETRARRLERLGDAELLCNLSCRRKPRFGQWSVGCGDCRQHVARRGLGRARMERRIWRILDIKLNVLRLGVAAE